MRILFLHPNFPGQFKHIASACAKAGHDTIFLCQTHYGRKIKGVKRLTLKGKLGNEYLDERKLSGLKRNQELAKQYRRAFENLNNEGWIPELVVSHSGWGCGTNVKEIWPKIRLISYLEWWFEPCSSFFTHDESNEELNINKLSIQKQWIRNQTIALELVTSDAIVSPTQWQKSQLPPAIQSITSVIFDGIDTSVFRKSDQVDDWDNSKGETITYGTRGMDPMRAFPQFIRALPDLLEKRPSAKVEIAGVDEVFYGRKNKNHKISWGMWAKNFLQEQGVEQRVKWLGYLEPQKYVNWLKASSCHIYLTHPFIASWSFVEALCCNIPIVASNVEPVQDFWEKDCGIELVDHRVDNFLTEPVLRLLECETRYWCKREVVHQVDISVSISQWGKTMGADLTPLN